MKKLFLILSVALFALGTVNAFAQEAAAAAEETAVAAETALAGDSMHHIMMQKFLEGGWEWMLPVLLCLVIGLAVAIERILYLSLSTINTKKLIANVEEALRTGGIEAAKEVARNTRGPIDSISPLCSATSMNTEGATAPISGCCQRNSASAPMMRWSDTR